MASVTNTSEAVGGTAGAYFDTVTVSTPLADSPRSLTTV